MASLSAAAPPLRTPRRGAPPLGTIFAYLALAAFAFFFLFPILWMVLTSFKSGVDAFAIPPKWLFEPTLENYRVIFWRQPIWLYFRNSLTISLGSVALSLVVGSLAAYGLSRLRLRGQESLAFWFLSQRMMPLVIVAIPLYLLFREWDLLDTRRGLILAYTNLNLPFVVWMMRTFFDDIPIDLEDASLVDGASRFGTFLRVAVPLAAPGLVATAIFCLVLSWNEFLLALVLTGPNTKTLPLMVAGFLYPSGSQGFNWGPITAMSMVMTLPVFLFSLLVQRHLVRGLTMGALKD